MLRVTVLGSGSRGNAIIVDGTEGTLLIDAGFSARSIVKRLLAAGRRAEQLTSLVLTHEHTDHSCGAAAMCSKWKLPLHATQGTIEALRESADGITANATALAANVSARIDGFDVRAIPVPHDARECAALVITDRRSGARLGVALDLGHVPSALPDAFAKLDLLVVESNHDEQLLVNGPYPWSLKQRIGGALGHLSNDAAAAFAASCVHRGLRGVMLAHLSETNNTPEHALTRMRDALRRASWRSDSLWAAQQRDACGPIGLHGITTASTPVQLSFGL